MGMMLCHEHTLDTTKNRGTVDIAFKQQVMQVAHMIRKPNHRAHSAAWQAWPRWFSDGHVALEVNLKPLFITAITTR